MATFDSQIRKDRQKADKTWNVVIKFSHNRQTRYIPTTMYVDKRDLTSSFKIKNRIILDRCEELVRRYRNRMYELELEVNDMDIDAIVRYITAKNDNTDLSFTEWFAQWRTMTRRKGERNYATAVNAYSRFLARPYIMMSDITVRNMMAFEKFLEGKPRARSQYTMAIQKIFNDAREYYNDEDAGIIRIKHTLNKYHAPKQNVAEKRALSVEQIRSIFELPHEEGTASRYNLALDCFMLSFCLMGMNSADLYNAERMENGCIIYNRTKTKDRRSDRAEMRVIVHPLISSLVEKYADTTGEKVFNFHRRFSAYTDLNRAINIGLKEVGRRIGMPGLQYYAARHSMATIAINDVRLNKYLVNDMLCHVDDQMRITDLYIKKDFAPMNDANKQLIDYVFK